MAWLEGEWNNPDRGDHYLMQLAAVTAGAKRNEMSKFKIPFETRDEMAPDRSMDVQEASSQARSRWNSVLRRSTRGQ